MSETLTNHDGNIIEPKAQKIPTKKEDIGSEKILIDANKIVENIKIVSIKKDLTKNYKIDISQPDQIKLFHDFINNHKDDILSGNMSEKKVAHEFTRYLMEQSEIEQIQRYLHRKNQKELNDKKS